MNYVVEASDDLSSWSPLTELVGSPQLNPDGTQTVTIRDSAPANTTSRRTCACASPADEDGDHNARRLQRRANVVECGGHRRFGSIRRTRGVGMEGKSRRVQIQSGIEYVETNGLVFFASGEHGESAHENSLSGVGESMHER